MEINTRNIPSKWVASALFALLMAGFVRPGFVHAQKNAPPVAQVGVGSPLPVYVVNEVPPALPDGFIPGTTWKFSSWTVPSSLSFVVSVQKTEGGWALLTLSTDPQAVPKWYYVPQMPGAWVAQ